jgi:hypothetical protein
MTLKCKCSGSRTNLEHLDPPDEKGTYLVLKQLCSTNYKKVKARENTSKARNLKENWKR